MRIQVIDTGSAANCYAITNAAGEILLLDCGTGWARLNAALGPALAAVVGCLVTHEHKDHSRTAAELERRGIPVYATAGTGAAIFQDRPAYNFKDIKAGQQFNAGAYAINSFATIHGDAAEPVGFLISSGGQRLLYATDTAYMPVQFKGLKYALIECNYIQAELLQQAGSAADPLLERIINTHMSAETLARYIVDLDKSRLCKIILIHISNERGNDAAMLRMIRSAAEGVPVYAALPGDLYD